MRIAVVVAVLTMPALAHANPITAGLSVGSHHDKVDSDGEGNRSLGIYGRVGLSARLAGQLEIQKIETDDQTFTPTTIRTATIGLRFDLVDPARSRLVPTLAFGVGLDRATTDFDTQHGTHLEGGLGLEYRAEGGFNVGLDLRLGGRTVDGDEVVIQEDAPAAFVFDPGGLREGEYRALRVTAGVTF